MVFPDLHGEVWVPGCLLLGVGLFGLLEVEQCGVLKWFEKTQ